MGVAANQDKALLHTIFSTWLGSFLKYKAEKDIHDKFRRQIDDAERKLIEYKEKQLNGVRGVLMRKATADDGEMQRAVLLMWQKAIKEFKGDEEQQQHQKELQAK